MFQCPIRLQVATPQFVFVLNPFVNTYILEFVLNSKQKIHCLLRERLSKLVHEKY